MSHSQIGPSSAERWIACPASVRLSAACTDRERDIHAAAGTVAHALAEELVTDKVDDLDLIGRIGTKVMCEGFEIEITHEMLSAVSLYRDVIQKDQEALVAGSRGEFHRYAETKIHVKSVDEELWGTADYIQFIKGHRLVVYDFKFGKGVVEAEKNPQMALYGLGAMETVAGQAFDSVELVIVQPRAEHKDGKVRRWTAPKEWLEAFRVSTRNAVEESKRDDARIVMGDHCKWCAAKPTCPAHHEKQIEKAQADFDVVVDDLELELLGPKREPLWPL